MSKARVFVCDFCGKTQLSVEQLITQGDVAICNECVALCVVIIEAANTASPAPNSDKEA